MTDERRAFEDAIRHDRYDRVTRLVFADWLDERGLDAEAQAQREWTAEWQRAEDWLRDFADRAGVHSPNYGAFTDTDDDDWVPVTYEDVMGAAAEWVRTCEESIWSDDGSHEGEYWTQMGQESLRNMMVNHETREKFWECYQIVTRAHVPAEKRGLVFSCSC